MYAYHKHTIEQVFMSRYRRSHYHLKEEKKMFVEPTPISICL
jgi:hypothetical protein